MGAIKDRSTITVEHCLTHCRMAPTTDATELFIYGMMLDSIKEAADHICDNPFVVEDEDGCPVLDEDGEQQPVAVPSVVELWILRKFAKINEYRLAGDNNNNMDGLGSITIDKRDWKELTPAMKFYHGPRE